jgi:hypothetical protein
VTEILLAHTRAIVFHGRWQDVIPLVRQASLQVHVTITDPPYSPHVQANIRSCDTSGAVQVKEWHPDFAPLGDLDHVLVFLDVTDRWVLCFCDLESFGIYRDAAGGQRTSKATTLPDGSRVPANKTGGYIRSWVWRKKQAAPQLSGDRPANSCEGIAVMHPPGRTRWNGRGAHAWTDLDRSGEEFPEGVDNCCDFGRDRSEKRHAAQKPAQLCEHLVEKFTDPGERIADWYCGSGAIPVAALKLGRTVIACDDDRTWAQFTADRLREML